VREIIRQELRLSKEVVHSVSWRLPIACLIESTPLTLILQISADIEAQLALGITSQASGQHISHVDFYVKTSSCPSNLPIKFLTMQMFPF